jgi:hypothetical protein
MIWKTVNYSYLLFTHQGECEKPAGMNTGLFIFENSLSYGLLYERSLRVGLFENVWMFLMENYIIQKSPSE